MMRTRYVLCFLGLIGSLLLLWQCGGHQEVATGDQASNPPKSAEIATWDGSHDYTGSAFAIEDSP